MRNSLFLAALLLPATLLAQTTQPDLEARLVHKELYLRGFWSNGKLRFNADGQIQGKFKTTTFKLAGAEIKASSSSQIISRSKESVSAPTSSTSKICTFASTAHLVSTTRGPSTPSSPRFRR